MNTNTNFNNYKNNNNKNVKNSQNIHNSIPGKSTNSKLFEAYVKLSCLRAGVYEDNPRYNEIMTMITKTPSARRTAVAIPTNNGLAPSVPNTRESAVKRPRNNNNGNQQNKKHPRMNN